MEVRDGNVICFGVYELNVPAGELRKNGVRLKLGEQPVRVLHYLTQRPGEVVTREELRKLLWGDDTFVDFDHGVNTAVNKLRDALGDSAANPRFIETVPRRGYRFIGEIRTPESVAPEPAPARRGWLGIAGLVLVAALAGAWLGFRGAAPTGPFPMAMRPLTADSGLTTEPVMSRDGKFVAYVSDRATSKNLDLWVHPLAAGAQPIRLTKDDADERFPDFSPDGGLIVYRSERDGGGLYVVPALGGEERLLVRGGRFPRFSPDGKSVAYSVGGANWLHRATLHVIPLEGGPPRDLAAEFPWAAFPAFSPDGRHILFEGTADSYVEAHDWWVIPTTGGSPVKTGALAILAEQLKIPRYQVASIHPNLLDGRVLFAYSGRIWEMDLEGPGWKAKGPARPLTAGSTVSFARAGSGARMVFENTNFSRHLWRLKVDWNQGKAKGEMEPVPHSGGGQDCPSASADGRLLAYRNTGPNGSAVQVRDMASGKDSMLVNLGARPKVSPDGAQVAYNAFRPDSIHLISARGGAPATLFPAEEKLAMQVRSWTADGKKILYWTGEPFRWFLMDVATRVSSEFISHPKLVVYTVELSPDERWVAFATAEGAQWNVWIAPVRDGRAAGEKEWILVNKGRDERPWWSPDGNLLYTVSQRDGTRCLWAQRLDPATKRPKGDPFAVYHIHGTRVKVAPSGLLAEFGPALLPDGMIFGLNEYAGNVWIGEADQSRNW